MVQSFLESLEELMSSLDKLVNGTEPQAFQIKCTQKEKLPAPQEKTSILNRYPYGIEIEFTGISIKEAANTVADVLHVECPVLSSYYNEVEDLSHRIWVIKKDESIRPEGYGNHYPEKYKCELATPVFNADSDMQDLEAVVNALTKKGARCNTTTGIHVHVGGNYSSWELYTLVSTVSEKDALIKRAVRMYKFRSRWCDELSEDTVQKIRHWSIYSSSKEKRESYPDRTRYRTINIQSYFRGKGVELRCFNATLNTTRIKNYVILALGICSLAGKQLPRPKRGDDDRILKHWLSQMDFNEKEYEELFALLRTNLLKTHYGSGTRVAHIPRY